MLFNRKSFGIISILSISAIITGCGKTVSNTNNGNVVNAPSEIDNTEYVNFRKDIDKFCNSVNSIDTNINSLDTASESYISDLSISLEALSTEFTAFAALDFPEDYDYLESLADEADSYMTTAVTAYIDAFGGNYSSTDFESKYNYAEENYARAYKRVQIILTFLNGEISEDVTISK